MKTKTQKQISESGYSPDLMKVALAALIVTVLLLGSVNLFSLLASALFG